MGRQFDQRESNNNRPEAVHMTETIFPPADDDGFQPFRDIGAELKLHEDEVYLAFRGLPIPEWSSPRQIRLQKDYARKLDKAATSARRLFHAYQDLPPEEMDSLIIEGGITLKQLSTTLKILESSAETIDSWAKVHDTKGGRNPAAHIVAEGMRRLFRRQRWEIGCGQDFHGHPSTKFGRAVEVALRSFDLAGHWRKPTEAATSKQKRIQSRMLECSFRKARLNNTD